MFKMRFTTTIVLAALSVAGCGSTQEVTSGEGQQAPSAPQQTSAATVTTRAGDSRPPNAPLLPKTSEEVVTPPSTDPALGPPPDTNFLLAPDGPIGQRPPGKKYLPEQAKAALTKKSTDLSATNLVLPDSTPETVDRVSNAAVPAEGEYVGRLIIGHLATLPLVTISWGSSSRVLRMAVSHVSQVDYRNSDQLCAADNTFRKTSVTKVSIRGSQGCAVEWSTTGAGAESGSQIIWTDGDLTYLYEIQPASPEARGALQKIAVEASKI